MILAKKVTGPDDAVALEPGLVLALEHIGLLHTLGVSAVFVRFPAQMDSSKEIERQIQEYVRNFFIFIDPDHEAFLELYRIAVQRSLKAFRGGWILPCDDALRAKNVEHLSDLFFKDAGEPEDIVRHEVGLASFPDIYFRIREVLDNPKSSAQDIANVVNTDVGFSAKLLRLVNSPFFGFSTSIDSVARAVSLVGVKEISTLALGISTINYFQNIPPELMDMRVFWQHSLRCAVFAKLLAAKRGLPSDRFFTAGLLHDVGRLVIFKNMPYASVEALLYARSDMVPLVEAESSVLGYNHADVGKLLLEAWKFPAALTDVIAHHHSPDAAPARSEAAIIQLADIMANVAEISAGGLFALPGMDLEDWRLLDFLPRELASFMELHDEHFQEITSVLL
jgi:putative nucleotidyltransferase with HDIG domain